MKDNLHLNILVVGSVKWYDTFLKYFKNKTARYHFEFISELNKAILRLDHNSYDVLIIEDNYIKDNSIKLSKKAYAMSRPTIILCSSFIRYLLYILWKIFNDWPNKFTLSKKMIFIKRINDLTILNNIDLLQKCHNNLNEISKEISSIVFDKN